jgi:hypothetical protein
MKKTTSPRTARAKPRKRVTKPKPTAIEPTAIEPEVAKPTPVAEPAFELLPPLTEDELRAQAPAIFTNHASPDVTDKYQFVSTEWILQRFAALDYVPVHAEQNKTQRAEYALHTVRLQQQSRHTALAIGGDPLIPQVIIVNSHNRTRRLTIMCGMYRLVCTNGLIMPLKDHEGKSLASVGRRLHVHGVVVDHLIENALGQAGRINALIDSLQHLQLEPHVQLQLAERCARRVYGDYAKHLDCQLFLAPRRPADEGDSAWLVYNRLQENFVKGGIVTNNGRCTLPLGANAAATGVFSRLVFNEHLWNDVMTLHANGRLN